MDLFSQLPQHIIHHILNFLPRKAAARTSVLCKSWKRAWDSRSRVDLDVQMYKENFPEFSNRTLARYVQHGFTVESLTISWTVEMHNGHQVLASMKQWIDFVFSAGNNLKQLKIFAPNFDRHRSGFPLNLHSSNTLTAIYLDGCKLENISGNIEIPSLQDLTLTNTPLDSDVIHKKFLAGSPFLKSLTLIACPRLQSIEISGLVRITSIQIAICRSLKRVDIQAPNLQDFSFSGGCSILNCEIKLAACDESLKKLKLSALEWPNNYWLQTMICRLVSLECLDLHFLDRPNNEALLISSPSLRQLTIVACSFNEETTIDAPNLRRVIFMDNKYPFYRLSLSTLNNSPQALFSFFLKNDRPYALWLRKLEEFFTKIDYVKYMKMSILHRNKNILILHKDFNYLLLCNIIDNLEYLNHRRLRFKIYKPLIHCEDIVKQILNGRMEPPNCDAIYIASSSSHNSKFIEDDFYKKVRRWKRTRRCSQHGRYKLKDLQIEIINLEQDITIRDHIPCALLHAYQALSYKLTRINIKYYQKRCRQ